MLVRRQGEDFLSPTLPLGSCLTGSAAGCTPMIPALTELGQESHTFEAEHVYKVRTCLKHLRRKKKMRGSKKGGWRKEGNKEKKS